MLPDPSQQVLLRSTVSMRVPALGRARLLYGRDKLRWTVLDVEFALARYKARHGKYPKKLEKVKPLMLSDGIDPFSGKLLKHRREKDGSFTIWSVGENLTDDGGEQGELLWDEPDYVWNSRRLRGEK